MIRLIGAASLILVTVVLVNADAGDGKSAAFKPILSSDDFKELSKRSIATIESIAKSSAKDAAEKCEAEAAILIGYTLSVKNDDDVAKVRGAAIQAVKTARKGDVKALKDFGTKIANATKAPAEVKDWKTHLNELQWMMENFRGKAKGGEGLHADLQYVQKLKNLNGTEAFLGAIAGKKLSGENFEKIQKELPNFAYRVAVMGSITHEFAPAKDAAQWRELAAQMRDSAVAVAAAAQKKDADGMFKAAQALENTCTKCHTVFKKN
jgi:hypothetical protein